MNNDNATLSQDEINELIIRIQNAPQNQSVAIKDFYAYVRCFKVLKSQVVIRQKQRQNLQLLDSASIASGVTEKIFTSKKCKGGGDCKYILFSGLIRDILFGTKLEWSYSTGCYERSAKYILSDEQRAGFEGILNRIETAAA